MIMTGDLGRAGALDLLVILVSHAETLSNSCLLAFSIYVNFIKQHEDEGIGP